MDKDDNPYEILGVPNDASESDIKKAFRKGALKYHPDRQQTEEDKEAAHHIFAKFSAAYETLTDPVKLYDWKLEQEKRNNRAMRDAFTGSGSGRGSKTPPPGQHKKPSASPATRHKSAQPPPPQQHRQANLSPKQSPKPPQRKQSAPPKIGGTTPTTTKKGPPMKFRDPFSIFEDVMKEEYGENFRNVDKSGWKESVGVPGLSKINPFKKRQESSKKEFKKLDVNNDKSLSRDELGVFIESKSELWSTLGINLNLPVKKCIQIATDVAFHLALGKGDVTHPPKNKNREDERRELTEDEFKHFHKNYVLDENGSHEFYLRTIFAVFDLNGDGVLNPKELNRFLDIFYKAKDIFKGNMRLPEKKKLISIVGNRLDTNKDGVLSFHEIRDLLEVAAVVTAEK